jgi:uncharacterized protein
MSSSHAGQPNRLAQQTSPYLLQHAHNPVDWYPWGAEALARARSEDKPIFLSIGYSACHWCHVMERESFENPDVAALMNAHFVCVKVDREERPDLDEVYMKATQALSGHGGWPMSVWLAPDGRPFYAGTYFPPLPRWGQPGFVQVLTSLAQAWKSSREQVLGQADKVSAHVAQMSLNGGLLPEVAPDARAPGLDLLDAATQQLLTAFDKEHGGFGDAPKFPHADDIRLLLRQAALTGDAQALHAAVHSLDCMARGGVYDQLGGGFHRYSTDERWWIPHFEKMLYDNALLVPAYLEAARQANRPDFAQVARECCEWALREMAGPHGGLSSTQDADSEGEEGKYFVWQRDEVLELVGKRNAALVDTAWNLGDSPNFEGHAWALVRPRPDEQLARELKLDGPAALHAALAPLRRQLLERRSRRVPPGTDDKVLVAWNGLMLGALARAAVALEEPRFLAGARRAADFCLTALRPDGQRLQATWRQGRAQHAGTLPDYAALADGLLDLFEADGDPRWAREALALARTADARFADAERAGWYMTADDAESLFTRPRDLYDGAVPSGNGLMVEVCVRLFELTGDDAWRVRAERALATVEPIARQSPTAFARMLLALLRLDAATTIVIAGAPDAPGFVELRRAASERAEASAMVVPVPAAGVDAEVAKEFPLLAGKTARGGRPAAYVCKRGTCGEPAITAEALGAAVGG